MASGFLPIIPCRQARARRSALSEGAGFNLEYLRPAGDQFVLESTVTFRKTADGFLSQSVTHRPKEKMTLKLRWDRKHLLQTADLEQETAAGKQTATALLDNKTAVIKRPGQKDQQLTLAAEPVLATTAPDWSDILLVTSGPDLCHRGTEQGYDHCRR
jgi:hypothetical protein